jgi:hypothetical protein
MKLKGTVILKTANPGSKSEHEAVYFKTEKGEFLLQELGANFFRNEKLLALVGKELILSGTVDGNKFLLPANSLTEKGKE